MCARPCLSVITSGRHASVSGKYLRSGGVKSGFSVKLVPALAARELTDAVSVCTVSAAAVISTVCAIAPTFNLKSTCVEFTG
jgi:hypothetical protein